MSKQSRMVMIVCPKGKRYLHMLPNPDSGEADIHTHDGVLAGADLNAADYGAIIKTHLGKPYRLLKPTLYDVVKGVKRKTQILYPKDIGYICFRLGVGPGRRIVEAGSGSGSMTVALSWFVGPEGRVYTYEKRPEFAELCARNLKWAGLGENVEHFDRDIAEGFLQDDVDGLFLDVRTPWEYLDQAAAAVSPGSPLAFLVPTTNQVQRLLDGLDRGPFARIEVVEIFLRRYKPVSERLRPDDRMVAHTGFLIFAAKEDSAVKSEPTEEASTAEAEEQDPENSEMPAPDAESPNSPE